MRCVATASKIRLPEPPLKVLIVQLTHPARNSSAGVCRSGIPAPDPFFHRAYPWFSAIDKHRNL